MLLKKIIRLPRGFLGILLKVSWKPRKGVNVLGITNKIGHEYVTFLDYDITEVSIIRREIRSLQEKFMLGDFYLFKTDRGYHAINLDLLSYEYWLQILYSSSVEYAYKKVPRENGSKLWILRTTGKTKDAPTYTETVSGYKGRKQSTAHAAWLRARGAPIKWKNINRGVAIDYTPSLIYSLYEA